MVLGTRAKARVAVALGAAVLGVCQPSRAADRSFNVSLVGSLNPLLSTYGTTNNFYADLWADGDLVALGSVQSSNPGGVVLINNANPAAPSMISRYLPAGAANGQFRDVIVRNGIGYFAIDGGANGLGTNGGIHVVSLADPANPQQIAMINGSNGGFVKNHDLFLDGNYLYIADNANNIMKVFDVANPTAPSHLRDITTAGILSDDLHDMTVKNGRMYTSNLSNGITQIWDVSNMSKTVAPTLLGSLDVGTGDRNHGSWPNEAGTLLAVARETTDGEVRLYNISNPASPTLLSSITAAAYGIDSFSAHNPVIVGETLFVSWYQAGLQIFNIRNPAAPVHLGAYDTFVGGKGNAGSFSGYDGNWGLQVDGLDKILLSDFDNGFFTVDATEAFRQHWTWNANAAWQNNARWSNGSGAPIFPDGPEMIAAFTSATGGTIRTVTVDGTLTPNKVRLAGLEFASNSSYTLDPAAGGEIEMVSSFGGAKVTVTNGGGSPGVNRVNVPLVLSDDLLVTNNAGSTPAATLELGALRGTNRTITFAGTGDTALVAANPSFTGSITLTGGKLSVRHGQATNGQPISVSGGTLVLRNNAAVTNYGSDATFTGTSFLAVGNGGSGSGQTQQLDAVTVTPAGAVTIVRNNANHFRASDVTVNGTMTISPQAGAPVATRFETLSVSPSTGRLNVQDAPLVIGSTPLSAVEQTVVLGANNGAWDGHGIVTTQPDALSGLTSLGVATADQTGYTTFGGISVAGDDVLVMYTYAGDANLDGFISGDDYASIDFSIAIPGGASGWYNGDFNHDGIISGDDYATIDFNIVAQGAPFPTGALAATASTLAAVPEPSAVACAILGLAAPLVRRRRRHPYF